MTAARYRVKPDGLDRIIRMNGPVYQRVRAACCDIHGFDTARDLDRHAAAIVHTISLRAAVLEGRG